MKQNYQTIDAAVKALAMPESVSVAIGEIVADVGEGLLAMAVGAGLQVMVAMMDADVAVVCGPKGKHDPHRTAVRHGSERGSVTLGGRRVPIERPRMRAADGSGELAVASYEQFTSTEGVCCFGVEGAWRHRRSRPDQMASASSAKAVVSRYRESTSVASS